MGWFAEQIKERIRRDDAEFLDAMEEIRSIITGTKQAPGTVCLKEEQGECITYALREILRYYRFKVIELPHDAKSLEDQLEFFCRPCGIMHRTVKLEKGWYRDSIGAMLGFRKNGNAVALIPGKCFGYLCYDSDHVGPVRLSKKTEDDLEETAICFYKPFPVKKNGISGSSAVHDGICVPVLVSDAHSHDGVNHSGRLDFPQNHPCYL